MNFKNIPWALIIILSCIGLYPVAAVLAFLKLFIGNKKIWSYMEHENNNRKVNPYESDMKFSSKDDVNKTADDIKEINVSKIEIKDGQYKSVSENHEGGKTDSEDSIDQQRKLQMLKRGKNRVKRPVLNKLLLGLGVILFVFASVSSLTNLINFFRGSFVISEITKGLTLFLSGTASLACSALITRRYNNALKYTAVIGDNEYYDISELASIMMISERKAKKQLQKLINDGVFGSGAYIDYKRNRFYSSSYSPKANNTPGVTENKSSMDEYDSILKKIRELNDDIEDKAMSDKIDEIEALTRKIFLIVKEHPEKLSDIHTFMTYYLPTTLKLLETYSKIEETGAVGKHMTEAKQNIEKTMDMLSYGFSMQLDNLYKDESLDISSDIEVLEKMMYKDGLTGNSPYDIFSDDDSMKQGGV